MWILAWVMTYVINMSKVDSFVQTNFIHLWDTPTPDGREMNQSMTFNADCRVHKLLSGHIRLNFWDKDGELCCPPIMVNCMCGLHKFMFYKTLNLQCYGQKQHWTIFVFGHFVQVKQWKLTSCPVILVWQDRMITLRCLRREIQTL